jgi:hypothetical protein
MTLHVLGMTVLLLVGAATSFAQQTTGEVVGRIVDQQSAAVPGATITARNPDTGFVRTEVSDAEGLYRLTALPVAIYDITAELQGFETITKKRIEVNVAQALAIDFTLKVAPLAERVDVLGAMPLLQTTNASVGQVVDLARVERLPLNGRQFANLAATVPGVGIGVHSDPTKGVNFAPIINGGAGRNVNYLIDGGDNNDDSVGGLLQQFPLEAIQEFNFQTQRFNSEYGRSNGGVMNIVTKSGTNQFQGSVFEFFRDKSMNALTETEQLAVVGTSRAAVKGDYRRNQFGGSFGGPISRDKAHFFFALERTQQDTTQIVNTRGLFPAQDGPSPVEYRENLGTGKAVAILNPSQYLTVRYGRNNNSFPYGVAPTSTPNNWGDSENRFNSFNVNHNWVFRGARLNEFIFQYADFNNHILGRTPAVNESFPNGVVTGGNTNLPQATEQRKFQFRDDFSWHATRHGGLGHDFKTGVNFIHEPRLFFTLSSAKDIVRNAHLTNDLSGPISDVVLSQGDSVSDVSTRQYGIYFQDAWRVSSRLTVNAGVRYDLVTGIIFDQSNNPNFVKVQAAARAGLLNGIVGLENFALDAQDDRNNVQPRVGAVFDVRGNGKDVVRGGWGVYTDFGYTNSNVMFPAMDAGSYRFGNTFNASDAAGLRNPDGSFYQAGQPLGNLSSQNQVVPGAVALQGQWVDPRLQQPQQLQTNAGWSHELTPSTAVSVDFVNSLGRNLNYRPRLNQRIPGTTTRRLAVLIPGGLTPNTSSNRPALSRGKSEYNALILSVRRRMSRGIDFTSSYTLSRGLSTIGNASDELNTANIQNPDNPFDNPVQLGPNATTDARHRFNFSAAIDLPRGFRIAPIYSYRSALPVVLIDGRDLNLDGDAVDIPARAFAVDSFDAARGVATAKDIGACETVNCGRGYSQQQLNLRVSKLFRLARGTNVEAIGELFNVFNSVNPSGFLRRVTIPSGAQAGQPDPTLLQPTTFSGDFFRPEQRVGQLALRITF